jgi:hypothetical protein
MTLKLSPLFGLMALSVVLVSVLAGCQSKPEAPTPVNSNGDESKTLPHNTLLDGAFPAIRQDAFYTTYITSLANPKEKATVLHDRLVANGKGFVSYCEDQGFDNGFYLYNFYGHTCYFVQIKERTYKVAMSCPGDDLIVAYQHIHAIPSRKAANPEKIEKLPDHEQDGYVCEGVSYTSAGVKHEDWFDKKGGHLIMQVVEHDGKKYDRHLQRLNAECETLLLRMPQGFTLEK